jgi:outer membrane biosynthesis protein TonB
MMITSCKRFDGWALGFDKVGESSGEREGKFENVPVPPQPTPKDKFAAKPNQLLKPREKPSEKPSGKPSEKPREEPHPKPTLRSIRFHCEFCGKDGHKREFCSKRRREARMAMEWANKDRYHPSHGVPEPRMPLPKEKCVVHTVPSWRDRRTSGGGKFASRGPSARPVRVTGQTGARQSSGQFGFRGHGASGFSSLGHGADGRHF